MSRPASEPTCHNRTTSSVAASRTRIVEVRPLSTAETAVPASASRTGPELAPRRPSAYTTSEATAAPAKENHTYPRGESTPSRAIAHTTAQAAPELTPRMPGSASGLRVNACISVPASPSATPAARPTSVRGSRRSRTILLW